VQFPQQQTLDLAAQGDLEAKALRVHQSGRSLKVENLTNQPVLLQSLMLDGAEEELLNVIVDGGETIELHPEKEFQKASLNVRVVRELDMIIPRSRCLIRHRAERYEPSIIPEIVFDLGVILSGSSVVEAREARLRKMLADNPKSAKLSSNLGAILVQKGEYAEAEVLLQRAYTYRFSLPDNGRRTQMLLHECRRRKAKSPEQVSRLRASPSLPPKTDTVTQSNGHEQQKEFRVTTGS
jgi:hypothetical protein